MMRSSNLLCVPPSQMYRMYTAETIADTSSLSAPRLGRDPRRHVCCVGSRHRFLSGIDIVRLSADPDLSFDILNSRLSDKVY